MLDLDPLTIKSVSLFDEDIKNMLHVFVHGYFFP